MQKQSTAKKEKLTYNLHIMITPTERNFFEVEATKRGLSVAALVRNSIYEKLSRERFVQNG